MREIKESDWKIFRQVHAVALERFCQHILDESELLYRDSALSAHQRYLALCRHFRERNKEVARLFDDFRRSTALWQLAAIKRQGLVTDEEFARFSQEAQNFVAVLVGESEA
jgi:hypothetical protein